MRFFTILKRDVVNIIQNPVLLLYNTAFPFLLIVVLGALSKESYGVAGVTSYDYYGITILIYSVLNVSLTSSNSFMEKSLKTSNLRILYSPIRISYVYLSKIVATFLFTSICFLTLITLLNLLIGVNFGGGNARYIMTMIIVFNFFTSSLGVLFCCIFKSEELANKILSPINTIMAIFGGLFFQLDGFGKTVERLTYISPVKWVAEGMFKIIYDQDITYFIPIMAVLIVCSIILIIGCKITFKVEDYV